MASPLTSAPRACPLSPSGFSVLSRSPLFSPRRSKPDFLTQSRQSTRLACESPGPGLPVQCGVVNGEQLPARLPCVRNR